MKKYFIASVVLNVVLAGVLLFIVQRLHGWRYVWFRFTHDEEGLYYNRRQLFEQLPHYPSGGIFFVGDSQIEQCEWRELFGDTLPIYNRGISCDHIGGVQARLSAIIPYRPATMVLCVGVNDVLFGATPAQIRRQYSELMDTIRRAMPQCRVLVNALLPVNARLNQSLPGNAKIDAVNEELQRMASEFSVAFINPRQQMVDSTGNLDVRYSFDGLHLNGAGYAVWREALLPALLSDVK